MGAIYVQRIKSWRRTQNNTRWPFAGYLRAGDTLCPHYSNRSSIANAGWTGPVSGLCNMYVSKRTTWLTDYETGVCLIRFTNCRFHFNDNFTSSYAQANPSAHPPVISWIFAVVLVCLSVSFCLSILPPPFLSKRFPFHSSVHLVWWQHPSSHPWLWTRHSHMCVCSLSSSSTSSSSIWNVPTKSERMRVHPWIISYVWRFFCVFHLSHLLAFNWLFNNRLTFPILIKCKSTGVHFHFSHWKLFPTLSSQQATTNDRCKDDNSNFLFRDSHDLHRCVLNEVPTPHGVFAFNECVY